MKIYENLWRVDKKIYKNINKGKFIKRLIKGHENTGAGPAHTVKYRSRLLPNGKVQEPAPPER